jgi:hypothetical protein
MLIYKVISESARYRRSVFTTRSPSSATTPNSTRQQAPTLLTACCRMLPRRPTEVAAIALANEIARTEWAIMAKDQPHSEPAPESHSARHNVLL